MRKKVILVCEECLSRNYTTTKNPQKDSERIEVKKFCPNFFLCLKDIFPPFYFITLPTYGRFLYNSS